MTTATLTTIIPTYIHHPWIPLAQAFSVPFADNLPQCRALKGRESDCCEEIRLRRTIAICCMPVLASLAPASGGESCSLACLANQHSATVSLHLQPRLGLDGSSQDEEYHRTKSRRTLLTPRKLPRLSWIQPSACGMRLRQSLCLLASTAIYPLLLDSPGTLLAEQEAVQRIQWQADRRVSCRHLGGTVQRGALRSTTDTGLNRTIHYFCSRHSSRVHRRLAVAPLPPSK